MPYPVSPLTPNTTIDLILYERAPLIETGLKIRPVQQGVLGGNLYEVGTRRCVLIDQVLASAQLYPNSNTTTPLLPI